MFGLILVEAEKSSTENKETGQTKEEPVVIEDVEMEDEVVSSGVCTFTM